VKRGLAHLSQNLRAQLCLLEELDGHFTGHDTDIIAVGLAEKLAVYPLFLWGEVKIWCP
jgi:hypothetical protein